MRTKYPGVCYRCLQRVEAGYGDFQRQDGRFVVNCFKCQGKVKFEEVKKKPYTPSTPALLSNPQ